MTAGGQLLCCPRMLLASRQPPLPPGLPCLQAVALDPRYAARKTREVIYGTGQGTLILSSKVRLCV